MLWTIRLVAALLIGAGLYLVVNRLFFGLLIGNLRIGWTHYQGVGEGHFFAHGLAMLAIGIPLAILSRRAARWIVAMPDAGCPACGYTGERDAAGRCPECGASLGQPRTDSLSTTKHSEPDNSSAANR